MPVGAAIGAAGSVGSALIGSSAAKSASEAQQATAQQALAQQKAMFDIAQKGLSPYISAGQNALPTLQALLTPGPSQTGVLSQLPGFQFASQWGTQAATNALAARGLGGSAGPLAKGISDYNTGLAQTFWGQDVNALQQFANTGANAGAALAGNATQTGANMAQPYGALGNAQASGILGSANALSGGITGATSMPINAMFLSRLASGSGGGGGLYGNGSAFPSASFLDPTAAFNPTGA